MPSAAAPPPDRTPRILVIRRDNIGDLVCTTPMFRALRARYPDAYIAALVNSYNLPVLANNPDIDEVFVYTKGKHRAPGQGLVGVLRDRLRLLRRLRRARLDYVLLPGSGPMPRALKLARRLKSQHIIGYTESGAPGGGVDIAVPSVAAGAAHEVENSFRLLAALGITPPPPAPRVIPDSTEVARARAVVRAALGSEARLVVGVHISARRPRQRWPATNHVALVQKLHARHGAAFVLFWSPGDAANPRHPGDDAKGAEIKAALTGVPVVAYPTEQLGALIAGLSVCDAVICSDGGAMHLAAALGKPIVCFFGDADKNRWRPWGVPHVLLQPPSRDVADISVDAAFAGFQRLLELQKTWITGTSGSSPMTEQTETTGHV